MRQSGILMHVTSLPSPGGLGDLGPEAYAFADFLAESGMKIWQVLPVGPVGYGESPYQSSSAFAGNPLLISPELLRREGLLRFEDSELFVPENPERADYAGAGANRMMLLRRAYGQSRSRMEAEMDAFRRDQPWADDFALFSAVKARFGGAMWSKWPERGIRNRRPFARWRYGRKLKEEADFHLFCQMLFRRQWLALKQYCNDRGISLFGDMPIYVAEDSADTWTHPKVFQLDRRRLPTRVAGVPPDYFSEDGQLWGNPLYNWKYLRKTDFRWWVDRMRAMAELYDIIRIDHFIGFANYYSIPYGAENARGGEWIIGPGKNLFRTFNQKLPGMRIVAEDLGCVNDRVRDLLAYVGYPGMRVMVFGFGSKGENQHLITGFPENCVAYTGTHDNDTVLGWLKSASEDAVDHAREVLGFKELEDGPAAFVKALMACKAETAVAAMQDILGLDNSARMNYPSTIGGNWLWRMAPGAASPELAKRLMALNRETGRQ